MELKLESKERLALRRTSVDGVPTIEVRIHGEPHLLTKVVTVSSKGRHAVMLMELQASRSYGKCPACSKPARASPLASS